MIHESKTKNSLVYIFAIGTFIGATCLSDAIAEEEKKEKEKETKVHVVSPPIVKNTKAIMGKWQGDPEEMIKGKENKGSIDQKNKEIKMISEVTFEITDKNIILNDTHKIKYKLISVENDVYKLNVLVNNSKWEQTTFILKDDKLRMYENGKMKIALKRKK